MRPPQAPRAGGEAVALVRPLKTRKFSIVAALPQHFLRLYFTVSLKAPHMLRIDAAGRHPQEE
jgi:hypothetical protein